MNHASPSDGEKTHTEERQRSKVVVWAALAGNVSIALAKVVAAWLTGSSAMWSEAVHSFVDTGNQWLMLLGMRRATRPPSEAHPFGHGLELYFWSFVVAILIFGLGAGVSVYQGIEKIINPHPIRDVWVSYLVLGISVLFEGSVWLFALRAFRRQKKRMSWIQAIRASKDPTVFTVLFEDTAALSGLIVALIGITASVWLNNPLYDGVASLVIGLILAATATLLANECRGLLTGEAVAPSVRKDIHAMLLAQPEIRAVHRMLTMHFAPHDVLLTVSVAFEEALSITEAQAAIARIEDDIRGNHPEMRRIFIEPRSSLSSAATATALTSR
jgi:cation diffusion facilitator family transporter